VKDLLPPAPDQQRPQPVGLDPVSFLAKERQAVRDQFALRPLTPDELRAEQDASWAQNDPGVQATYRGEFVVPFQRQVVAHGHDAAAVLAEAARLTGKPVEALPLVGVIDPLLDVPC
jgi:hypothetical protein